MTKKQITDFLGKVEDGLGELTEAICESSDRDLQMKECFNSILSAKNLVAILSAVVILDEVEEGTHLARVLIDRAFTPDKGIDNLCNPSQEVSNREEHP